MAETVSVGEVKKQLKIVTDDLQGVPVGAVRKALAELPVQRRTEEMQGHHRNLVKVAEGTTSENLIAAVTSSASAITAFEEAQILKQRLDAKLEQVERFIGTAVANADTYRRTA